MHFGIVLSHSMGIFRIVACVPLFCTGLGESASHTAQSSHAHTQHAYIHATLTRIRTPHTLHSHTTQHAYIHTTLSRTHNTMLVYTYNIYTN